MAEADVVVVCYMVVVTVLLLYNYYSVAEADVVVICYRVVVVTVLLLFKLLLSSRGRCRGSLLYSISNCFFAI